MPAYDFNWQLFYYPKERVALPRGTRVDIVAHYDNSADNPNNPDPERAVTFGEQSTDEMMFGMFEFVPKDGVSPVPATSETRMDALQATLPADSTYRIPVTILQADPVGAASSADRARALVPRAEPVPDQRDSDSRRSSGTAMPSLPDGRPVRTQGGVHVRRERRRRRRRHDPRTTTPVGVAKAPFSPTFDGTRAATTRSSGR